MERHDKTGLAANQANEPVSVQKRVGRVAPKRRKGVVVLDEIFGPDQLARCRLQTRKLTHCSEGIDLSLMHQWGRPRTSWITNLVLAFVFVTPESATVHLI